MYLFLGVLGILMLSFGIYADLYWEREYDKKKVDELNQLYECPRCNKYHRKYQRDIKEKSEDEIYRKVKTGLYSYEDNQLEIIKDKMLLSFNLYSNNVCPHCYYRNTHSVSEEYEWTKYHPDCPELDRKKYKSYKKAINEIERAAYEIRSMEKFAEKNGL